MFLQSYDNGDSQLDSAELLKFIQHNESVVELQSYADQESNKLLRSGFVSPLSALFHLASNICSCVNVHVLL